MGADRLHVVFGTGQAGSALAAHLAGLGVAVRTVSRSSAATLADGADWRAADVSDPEAAADAAKGAAVVCQCVNAPYPHRRVGEDLRHAPLLRPLGQPDLSNCLCTGGTKTLAHAIHPRPHLPGAIRHVRDRG